MSENKSEAREEPSGVDSPFLGARSSVKQGGNRRTLPWVAVALFAILLAGGAIFFFSSVFSDPLRTLREFPVEEYYSDYASLEGSRFRADLTTSGQVGWKEGFGRLVNCQVGEESSPVVVLIPEGFRDVSTKPGSRFQAELQVTEGGLLKVAVLQKR